MSSIRRVPTKYKTRHLAVSVAFMPEYHAWKAMIRRCDEPTMRHYKDYGGRGITVCDRWRNSFEDFYADMGDRPSPKHTLDRKDNDGNYEPSNCRWITQTAQNYNRRISSRNTNGYTGVRKQGNKWHVRINYKGKEYFIGSFATIEAAAEARSIAKDKFMNLALVED